MAASRLVRGPSRSRARRAVVLALASASLGLSLPSVARASPEDLFGYGAKSLAMGATGAASSDGFEAAYANPALLSRIRQRKLSLGFQGATFDLKATGPGLPGRISYAPAKGVTIGLGLPLPFGGVLRDRVAAALAFYTPTQILVRGRILFPETPQFTLLPDRAELLAAQAGVGVDLGYGLRAGAGFSAVAQIEGTVVAATDSTGRVGTNVQDQLIAVYAPILGLTYDMPVGPPHAWRLGLTYRGALAARFSVSLDGTRLTSLAIPVFNIAGLAQYDPAALALEAAYDRSPWLLAAGATYKRWSDYPGPLEPTILCPTTDATCGALKPAPTAYHDTVAVHLGADRAVVVTSSLIAHLRAGYFLEPSPLPDSLGASHAYDPRFKTAIAIPTRYFDATRHALTVGAGLDLSPFTLDIYGQLHLLEPRTMTLSPAPGGGPSTSSQASVGGDVLVAGMLVGVKF